MKIRGRVLVLAVSLPVIAFAVVGGFMSKAIAREDSYQYLRIFEDVVSLILNNYVEEVNVDKVMHGAMHGLADGLDPDSAYLDVQQVKILDKGDTGGTAQTGIELTRQYYLRVIAARDGSPAANGAHVGTVTCDIDVGTDELVFVGRIEVDDRRYDRAHGLGLRLPQPGAPAPGHFH